jgi:CHAT domain-containing protein
MAAYRRILIALFACATWAAAPVAHAGEAEYRALNDLAKKYFDEKNYAKSLEVNRLLVKEAESSFGPEHALTLRAKSYLALNLSANLLHEESIAVNRQILAIVEARGDLLGAAVLLGNIAGEYRRMGRYAEAVEHTRRVLALREKQLGPQHPQTADAMNFLALDLRRLGGYAEAEALLRKAIAVFEQTQSPNLVYGLNNLALLLSQRGRYGDAEPYYRRAVELAESMTGFEAGAAMAVANYAAALGDQGRHAEAERLLRRALDFRERSLGADHFGTAETLRNLAAAMHAQGRYAEAEPLLQRALKILQGTRGPNHIETAKAKHSIAVTLSSQARFQEAEPYAREALAVFEHVLGPEHPETADRMRAYARVLLERGDTGRALPLYLRAVETLRKAGLPRSLLVASSDVAHVLHGSGLLEQALPYYREAIDALDYLFAHTRGLAEEARYTFLGQYGYIYRHMIELLIELHEKNPGAGYDREALTVSSRNQSRIFTELLRQADAAKFARDPSFIALKQERDGLAEQVAALRATRASIGVSEQGAQTRRDNLALTIAEREKKLAAAEAALWRDFPRFMELSQPRAVSPEDLQRRLLKQSEALISYVLLPEKTAIFAVTRDRFAMQVRPVTREEIAKRIAAARGPAEQLASSGNLAVLRRLDPADLHHLYRELVAPVEELVQKSARVLIVGDGPLNTLPFEMLVVNYDAKARLAFEGARASAGQPLLAEYATLAYLGDRNRFAYLPSLAALASQRLYPKAAVNHATEFVSFADPIFETEGGQYGEATRSALTKLAASRGPASPALGIGLPRLPDTADEAREIARVLGGKADIYLRDRAQEMTVKTADLKNVRYLHFATHGFLGGEFVEVREALRAGSLAAAGGSASRAQAAKPQAESIQLPPDSARARGAQPALALTLVGNLGGEDGLLTMQEVIENLDINAQLVVLSACNTAGEPGSATGGEGFAGLTRAFMFAGAKGLLVSHWAVDSASTQELMSETFRQIKAGQSAPDALQAARKSIFTSGNKGGRLKYSREHPYFWAPFVYVGDRSVD